MLDIMSQAQNAIEAYNAALEASSANIANMNVTGYKKIDVSFQSIFEKLISGGSAASAHSGGTNPLQLGQGMSISSATIDFSSGEFTQGAGLDLAIAGQGLFIVSPDGGNTFRYTRSGNFQVDSAGNLTSNGMLVYGLNSGNAVVPIIGIPPGSRSSYQWLADGTLQYTADGTNYTSTGYRIALTYFQNPNGLVQGQGTTFMETAASGAPAAAQAPGANVGSLRPNYLEQSNVSYLSETINSLALQRAMSSNLTVVRMASDMISAFINKLS